MKDVSGVVPWPIHAVPAKEWVTGNEPGYLPGTSPQELGGPVLPHERPLPERDPAPNDDPGPRGEGDEGPH